MCVCLCVDVWISVYLLEVCRYVCVYIYVCMCVLRVCKCGGGLEGLDVERSTFLNSFRHASKFFLKSYPYVCSVCGYSFMCMFNND